MRLTSYNILNGGVGRADPVAEVIEAQRPDVVALIEADDAWVVERIARRLHMDAITSAGDGHAVALLSRWPIVRTVNHAALASGGPRSMVEAELFLPAGGMLLVMALHLHPRATPADEAVRVAQLRRVLAVTATWRAAGRPHVLVGDFNANAPGQHVDPDRCKPATRHAITANDGQLPRDAVGLLLDHGYVDTLVAAQGDLAFQAATFTTHHPGQRVDYAFAHGLAVQDAWIEVDRLATYASDHYPIGVDLRLPMKAAR